MAQITVSALEWLMQSRLLVRVHKVGMAAVAKLPPCANEQSGPTGVRLVARGALAYRDRRVNHRQAGTGADSTVTFTAKHILRLEHERLAPSTMRIMAGNAFIECWRVNLSRLRGSGILVTPDAEDPRLVFEEAVMVGLMPAMAGCALLGRRMCPRQCEFLGDIRMARAAELDLGAGEKRSNVRGVGVMTTQAVAFGRRVVDSDAFSRLRGFMAIEADGGTI